MIIIRKIILLKTVILVMRRDNKQVAGAKSTFCGIYYKEVMPLAYEFKNNTIERDQVDKARTQQRQACTYHHTIPTASEKIALRKFM